MRVKTSLMVILIFIMMVGNIYLIGLLGNYWYYMKPNSALNTRMVEYEDNMEQHETNSHYSLATKCSTFNCRLPNCFCSGTSIPGNLPVSQAPQLVLLTFDDFVNESKFKLYQEIFSGHGDEKEKMNETYHRVRRGRSNPNGCPILATFYVNHDSTDYSTIRKLYAQGHEIASHSITHSVNSREFSKAQWKEEIAGQRENLHMYGGVDLNDVRGMRAPYLIHGGNNQFEMLVEANFTYDSSLTIMENKPPFWPYTLDHQINHICLEPPCHTESFPGLWELSLTMREDLSGVKCYQDQTCFNSTPPSDENAVYNEMMLNFNRSYNTNKAPVGLYYHFPWFTVEHHRRGFDRFIDEILTTKPDVYFVTSWQLIQWMREPTPLAKLSRFQPFLCEKYK